MTRRPQEVQELLQIMRLASKFENDTDRFIHTVEEKLKKPFERKGAFFFWIGLNLFKAYSDHALASWKRASDYFIKYNDKDGESQCYINLGIGYAKKGVFDTAIKYCRMGLKIAEGIGDKEKQYICWLSLGGDYYGLSNFQKAIEVHSKALKIAKDIEVYENIENHSRELSCYFQLAHDYKELGNFQNSIENYDAALDISIGYRSLQVVGYNGKGNCFRNLGDFQKAVEAHSMALKIAKDFEDKDFEKSRDGTNLSLNKSQHMAASYSNLGHDYDWLGNYQKSIENYRAALDILRNTSDEFAQAKAYDDLGLAFYKLSDFQKALDNHAKALELAKDIQSRPIEDATYLSIREGVIEKYYIANRPIQRPLLSSSYRNIGNDYQKLGEPQTAVENHMEALNISRGVKPEEADIINDLGNDYEVMGNFHKALEYHTMALNIAQDIGYKALESQCYANLGNDLYYGFNNLFDAAEYYEKALQSADITGDLNMQRLANLFLGTLYRTKNADAAYNYLARSIDLTEDIRGKLAEEDHKISFFAGGLDAYKLIIDICLEFSKYDTGFEFLEKNKSRAFIDMLAVSKMRHSFADNLKPLFEQEQVLLDRLREVETRHLRNTTFTTTPGEVESLRQKLNEIYDKIKEDDPEYVLLRRGRPVSLEKVKNLL